MPDRLKIHSSRLSAEDEGPKRQIDIEHSPRKNLKFWHEIGIASAMVPPENVSSNS